MAVVLDVGSQLAAPTSSFVAVVGGSGFIGSHVVQNLSEYPNKQSNKDSERE